MEISDDCKDLIRNLLIKDPSKRLGSQDDAAEIKNHPWWKDLNFDDVLNRKLTPPIKPEFKDTMDVGFFDANFTSANPRNTLRDEKTDTDIIHDFTQDFSDFDYQKQYEELVQKAKL